jgi:DNA replication licensing factor MCM4
VDAQRDQQLARHIVGLYTTHDQVETIIPAAELTEYIAYAKENCNPAFTDEAEKVLIEGYVEMRKLGGRNVVSATPRQLESCVRLAEANAKMRLSPFVAEADAEEALRLMREALHQAATDSETGLIDMDSILTGISAEKRRRIGLIGREVIKMLQAVGERALKANQILANLKAVMGPSVTEDEVTEALIGLDKEEAVHLTMENGRPTKVALNPVRH